MSTPTWGIPATYSGEGGWVLGGGARAHPGGGADSAVTQRRSSPAAPGTNPEPQQYPCLHHLDAGPRVFRLDQLIHPLWATRMQPKHRPIRNMCRAYRLLLIQP